MLKPTLGPGLCPKGTQGFGRKTHPKGISKVPGGSMASAPTDASITSDIWDFSLQSGHFPIFFWETIPPLLLLLIAQAKQTPHQLQRWAHEQAWPIRTLHPSGHRDWHRVEHVAQGRPMAAFSRTFAGIAREKPHSTGVSKG